MEIDSRQVNFLLMVLTRVKQPYKLMHDDLTDEIKRKFGMDMLAQIKCTVCGGLPIDGVECDRCPAIFCSNCLDGHQTKDVIGGTPRPSQL